MSEFFEYSKKIATDFLQTAIIVDDEAWLGNTRKTPAAPSKEKIVHPDGRPITAATSSATTTTPVNSYDDVCAGKHCLDFKKLSDSFASKGIICSALKPEPSEREFVGKYINALKKADIVILDWNIASDDGQPGSALVKNIIKEIVKNEEKGHMQTAVRYIAIYSGEERLDEKLDEIRTELDTIIGNGFANTNSYKLKYGNLHISIYAKHSRTSSGDGATVVDEERLVGTIIDDFTDHVHGLVPNMALSSVGEIRKNTHRLLGIFSKDLDGAYLAHRSMLPIPNDAEEHMAHFISLELQSILYDGIQPLNNTVLNKWTKYRLSRLAENLFCEKMVDLNFNKKFFGESWPRCKEHLNGVCGGGNDFDRMNSLATEAKKSAFFEVVKQNKNAFESKFYEDFEAVVQDGFKQSEDKLFAKFIKGEGSSPIRNLNKFLDYKEKANDDFSILTVNKTFYSKPKPYLTLGTILKSEKGDYYLSLIPRCDAARIKAGDNAFPFLKLIEAENFEVIFKDGDNIKKCKILDDASNMVILNFNQLEKNHEKHIYPRKYRSEYIFKDIKDIKDIKYIKYIKYYWIAELKTEKAQNISNKFASKLSRVGFNEAEYLRLAYQRPNKK